MLSKVFSIAAFVVSSAFALGQTMTLASGTMMIAAGTRVELVGALDWQISSEATVVNDGLIELGSTATISEAVGSPITGEGTEHANGSLNAPFTDVDQGGLGLALSMPAALGAFDLVRGHVPLIANGSVESIARWYRLQATPVAGNSLDMVMHYDVTELNGGNATDLVLHSSPTTTGPWLSIPGASTPAQQLVSGSDAGPWEHITAFAQVITDVPGSVMEPTFSVFPTLTNDLVRISALSNDRITTWQLFDALGKCVASDSGTGQELVLDLSDHHPGALLLRINERHVFRLVKL